MGARDSGKPYKQTYKTKSGAEAQRWAMNATLTLPDGRTKRVRVYGKTAALARAELKTRQAAAAKGHATRQRVPTIDDLAATLIADRTARRNALTRVQYRSNYNAYVRTTLGARLVTTIRRSELIQLLSSHLGNGVAVRTVQGVRTVLKLLFDQALDADVISANPAAGLRLPTASDSPRKPVSAPDVTRLLTTHRADSSATAFLLVLLHGPRNGEVCGLRWHDVDFTTNVLTFRHQRQRDPETKRVELRGRKGKGDSDQGVAHHIDAQTARALAWHRQHMADLEYATGPDAFIFLQVGSGKPHTTRSLRDWLTALCAAAGVPRATPHQLRHTAATEAKRNGASVDEVAAALGHTDASVTTGFYIEREMVVSDVARRVLARVRPEPEGGA